MPSFVQEWMHSRRAGLAVRWRGLRFPALRGISLFLMDNLSLLNCRLVMGKAAFDRASGLVEYVGTDPVLKTLVVTYLDTEAASGAICRLADDPQLRRSTSERSKKLSNSLFDIDNYILALQGHLVDIQKGKEN